MAEQVFVVDERFHGPPGSGNGGYVCGRLAAYTDGRVEVTLRLPPPLGVPLRVTVEGEVLTATDGDRVVAEARPAEVTVTAPPPVDPAAAQAASERYPGHSVHPFPTCFVCGPERGADGLRIFPGPVDGRDVVTAPWTPAADLADAAGAVRPEFVWSALDCAGAWSLAISPERLIVLGRFSARIDRPVRAGEPIVVVGWPLGIDGRKMHAGTALYDAAGAVVAVAQATWVQLRTT
jgi:hypothetical protein